MTKFHIICLLAIATFITSCFPDDEGSTRADSFVEVTIDGEALIFDNLLITEVTSSDESLMFRRITAKIGDDPNRKIIIELDDEAVGTASLFYIKYTYDSMIYDSDTEGATMITSIIENETASIKGSFSGTLIGIFSGDTISVTLSEGIFEAYL